MREKEIEQKLVKEVRRSGGLCPKFTSPGMAGMPDRLVLMPEGKMAFVELKAPGRKMRPLQIRRKRQLENLQYRVFCLDSENGIKEVVDEIRSSRVSEES